MPTVESKSITIDRSNVTQYVTANGVTLDTSYLGNDVAFRSSKKTGYAVLNDAAKAVLYPNASAHPLKADSTMQIGASTKNNNNYVELQFGGTAVHHQLCANANETKTDLTDSAITGSTSSTEIRYKVNINSLFVAAIVTHTILTLYFNKYACVAIIAGNGVTSASVSNATPWDGDSVTFTATIKGGATWHGWYSDAACTQLVSTSQTYTTSAADLTLYAYATKDTSGTGIYLKQNGAYTQAQAVYKKINDVWVQQTDIATLKSELQSGKYKLGG